MKRTLLYILLLAVVVGCTRNNGDIGVLFGAWRLDTITTSGADGGEGYAVEDVADVFWSFQNQVIRMQRELPGHENDVRWGTWSLSDDEKTLTLDFTHSDNSFGPGEGFYGILPDLHLPADGAALTVRQLDKTHMSLIYTDSAAEKTYTYYFTKW